MGGDTGPATTGTSHLTVRDSQWGGGRVFLCFCVDIYPLFACGRPELARICRRICRVRWLLPGSSILVTTSLSPDEADLQPSTQECEVWSVYCWQYEPLQSRILVRIFVWWEKSVGSLAPLWRSSGDITDPVWALLGGSPAPSAC